MKHFALICFFALPFDAIGGDYATCLLKNLPGLQNEAAANAAIALCMQENPGGVSGVQKGSGRGWLSYKSGAECAMKEAADTRSQIAGSGIYLACQLLYDKPNPVDLFK
jgi:hypothetical protein